MAGLADRCKKENRQPEGSLPLPSIETYKGYTQKNRTARFFVRFLHSRLLNLIPIFFRDNQP
jgi:hypothetical protein